MKKWRFWATFGERISGKIFGKVQELLAFESCAAPGGV